MKPLLFAVMLCLQTGCGTMFDHKAPERMAEARATQERADWIAAHPTAPEEMKRKVRAGEMATITADRILMEHGMDTVRQAYIAKPARPLTLEIQKALTEKRICLGMTTEEVKLVYGGEPRVNRTVTASGTSEQWVYTDLNLYFRNGILEGWQD